MTDDPIAVAGPVRSFGRALAFAFAIGLLAWVPVAGVAWWSTRPQPPPPPRHTVSGEFERPPGEDTALARWLETQDGLEARSVERTTTPEGRVTVSVRYVAPAERRIEPPWQDLGYGRPWSTSSGYSNLMSMRVDLGARYYLSLLAACANLGFLVLGVRWWRKAGRAGAPSAPDRRPNAQALVVAIVVGAMVAGADRLWSAVPTVGGTMLGAFGYAALWPEWARIATAVVLPFTLPLAQEPFFRGYGLATFAAAGSRRGLWWTAAAFAVVQVMPTAWPPALCAGLAFGWLRRWSGTLVAPVVASAVLCVLAFAWPLATAGNPLDALLEAFGALGGAAGK